MMNLLKHFGSLLIVLALETGLVHRYHLWSFELPDIPSPLSTSDLYYLWLLVCTYHYELEVSLVAITQGSVFLPGLIQQFVKNFPLTRCKIMCYGCIPE